MAIEPLEDRHLLDARLLISEFSAANDNGIRDVDGDRTDWIELYNAGDESAKLDGWYLTDGPNRRTKWRIPPISLDPGAYQLIFASGKDRTDPAGQLHTNFRLAREGEYLALIEPDGQTVAFQYTTQYPAQIDDYSFGIPQDIIRVTALAAGAPATTLIPKDDSLGLRWTEVDFDDSQWIPGTTGVGYGRSEGFSELVGTDVKLSMIRGKNSTAYLRVPFVVDSAARVTSLTLGMKYDDGFVAYLNGIEVARRNAPEQVAFDSAAVQAHPNGDAIVFEEFPLDDFKSLLNDGENLLAIHGMNLRFSDTDFLMVPEIALELGGDLRSESRNYFPTPTPGNPNGSGVTLIVSDISHTPNVPREDQALTVSAAVIETTDESLSLTVHYRAMYDAETELPMLDDGLHGDGEAGDGVYGATIPAGVASPGQMIRYYVTVETQKGAMSRWPNFRDPLDSEEYLGTIVSDPDIESSKLPVMHLFMERPSGANTREGTRGSIFYAGEFYDNVAIDLHGNLTAGFPRKSRDIDFPRDHRFRVSEDFRRVDDINLLTNYTDPSKMRSTLVYETFAWAGAGTHYSFPVRTELNGEFHAIYDLVEDGDARFLERIGRDPDGALYNMEGPLDSLQGAEQRSGIEGDFSGLQSLVDGLKLEGRQRKQFLYDNANIPALANYLASLIITSYGDCCGKNYYVYQDTQGTGEWEAFPWDVNIGLGSLSNTFDEMRTDRSLYTGTGNAFFDALYADPDFNEMYLRRLRTLMDEIYGPPGSEGRFEQRIDELSEQLAPDAPTDEAKLARVDNRRGKSWEFYVDVLRAGFVDGRRDFLYNMQTVTGGGPVPEAQPVDTELAFGQIEASPASGNQDEEYIELVNPNSYAVDISGWSLSGAVRMEFQPGTVIPAGDTLYLSPNVNAFRTRAAGPSGGQGLFVQGGYVDRLPSAGGTLQVVDRAGRVAASAQFVGEPTPAQRFLRITELMYNPPPSEPDRGFDADDFEFIELRNVSTTTPVHLSGVQIAEAAEFDFATSPVRTLEPGQSVVLVSNQGAFVSRYGTGPTIAGQFGGKLGNGGEPIQLQEHGVVILDFTYQDDWYPPSDGAGWSLVIGDDLADADRWNTKAGWMLSPQRLGSPAAADAPGDVNHDGVFDQQDLAAILQAGKYLADQTATPDEGDFNGDGMFNQRDLVFALQWGRFQP